MAQMKFENSHVWKVWSRALGEKSGYAPDHVTLVRTIIILIYLTTNLFIIAGVIRHF
jgi:hypothetical protein